MYVATGNAFQKQGQQSNSARIEEERTPMQTQALDIDLDIDLDGLQYRPVLNFTQHDDHAVGACTYFFPFFFLGPPVWACAKKSTSPVSPVSGFASTTVLSACFSWWPWRI